MRGKEDEIFRRFVQVVAAIAEIELPLGGWPDLINTMLENIQTNNAVLKQSTLQAIGFVCEAIVRNHLIACLQIINFLFLIGS